MSAYAIIVFLQQRCKPRAKVGHAVAFIRAEQSLGVATFSETRYKRVRIEKEAISSPEPATEERMHFDRVADRVP